jgi:hypothetical protein
VVVLPGYTTLWTALIPMAMATVLTSLAPSPPPPMVLPRTLSSLPSRSSTPADLALRKSFNPVDDDHDNKADP